MGISFDPALRFSYRSQKLRSLERIKRRAARPRIVLHYGHPKQRLADYTGPRHQVTVRQISQEELPPKLREQLWFEREERPVRGGTATDNTN